MSESWSEATTAPQAADPSAVPAPPKSLLEQMQELLASVTADLAALQSSGARGAAPAPAAPADGPATELPDAPRPR